jgi:hypothetical protein
LEVCRFSLVERKCPVSHRKAQNAYSAERESHVSTLAELIQVVALHD